MKAPLVSIIINNFNYGQFLPVAIASALAQTYHPVEVIVVDDGSSDQSLEIIAGYGNQIHPILKVNGGQASTFNAGFAASRGEIIIFLDADDALFPETIAQVVTNWQPGISKLQYRLRVCDRQGKPLGLHPAPNRPLDRGWVWPVLLRQGNYTTPVTSGNAFSRAALSQMLPMPEADYRIAADGYLNTRVAFLGPIAALEMPLGLYRMHGQNLWATGATGQGGVQEISVERLRKFIRHDLQRFALIQQWGEAEWKKIGGTTIGAPDAMRNWAADLAADLELGDLTPAALGLRDLGHLKHRLLSLRLNPRLHPLPQDSVRQLLVAGWRATWSQVQLSTPERLRLGGWFLWVGLLPLPLVQPLLTGNGLSFPVLLKALGTLGWQSLRRLRLQRV